MDSEKEINTPQQRMQAFLERNGLVVRICDGAITFCDGDCEHCEDNEEDGY